LFDQIIYNAKYGINNSLDNIQMRKHLPLIGLLTLIILLVVIFYISKIHGFTYNNEGFLDPTTIQTDFVKVQEQNFNPIGISLIAANSQGVLGTTLDPITKTIGSSTTFPLSSGKTGLFATIAKCEAVNTTDCSAFDDPNFSKDCGLCLDIGQNSRGAAATGGLVLLPDDRTYPRSVVLKGGIPDYQATVGTCPANRLVSSKAECLKMQRKITCQKNGSYDLQECSQCYSDQSYDIVDSNPTSGIMAGTGSIYVTGNGTLSYTETGYLTKSGISLSKSSPYVINLQGPETTRVSITVTGGADGSSTWIAGYLGGTTATGQFTLDLYRVVLTDTTTGRKPRTMGSIQVSGNSVTKLAPGFGQSQMSLVLPMPFTFVDPATQEASMCKDAPFVTKQASSEFLNSDPCYKKGSGPGKYSLECLQNLYLANSCITEGKGYPKDTVSANSLMTNADGSYRSLNDIAEIVYSNAVASSTGISSDGVKLEIPDWSKASVFCTGKVINSPCDVAGKATGPLSTDCLNYLWINGGGKKNAAGVVNPSESTYSIISTASSLFSKDNSSRFCQAAGTLSPIDANGNINQSAINYWRSQGGVEAVKAEMNNIHMMANSSGLADAVRLPYLTKCYGLTKLAAPVLGPPLPGMPPAGSPANAALSTFQKMFNKAGCSRTLENGDGTVNWWRGQSWETVTNDMAAYASLTANCTGHNGQTQFCRPGSCQDIRYDLGRGRIGGYVDMVSQDYTMEFDFVIKGTVGGWGNIVHVTTNENCCEPGQRTPAIWLFPGGTQLHVRVGDIRDGNWGIDTDGLPTGTKLHFLLRASGNQVTVSVNGRDYNATQPNQRFSGDALLVYMCDPWHDIPNIDLYNFKYVVGGNQVNIAKSGNAGNIVPSYVCSHGNDHGGDDIQCFYGGMTNAIMKERCDNDPRCNGYNTFVNGDVYGGCLKTKTTINNGFNPTVINMCAKTKVTGGNNGTVTCETYCQGPGGGSSWNNELPQSWNGATCVGSANNPAIGCHAGSQDAINCICKATGTGWR